MKRLILFALALVCARGAFASPPPTIDAPATVLSIVLPRIFALPQNPPGAYTSPSNGAGGCSVTGFTSGHIITNDGAGNCTDGGISAVNLVTASRSASQTIQATGANTTLNVSSTGAQTALNVFPGSDVATAFTVKNAAQTTTILGVDTTSGGGGVSITANGNANALQITNAGNSFSLVDNSSGVSQLGTLRLTGALNKYTNTTTSGNGIPVIFGSTSQKSESAADANVLTANLGAFGVGSWRVRFVMSVSAASAATLGWTITYTDSNSNAQTPTNLALFQMGTAAPALTFTTSAAGNYYGYADIDVSSSSTLVVKLTFSGTSFTAKVTATAEKLI